MIAFLKLEAGGDPIVGKQTMVEAGGVDVSEMIQLTSFGVGMDREVGADGRVTGSPTFRRLTAVKELDKASPLLLRALARAEPIEGEVRVFGSNPDSGMTEETFQIVIREGTITSVDWDGAAGEDGVVETVEIAYRGLRATHVPDGTETEVSPSGP